MNFIGLLSLALAPGIAIGIYIYLKDSHEREPILLLLLSFLYGGFSTAVTYAISYPIHLFFLTENANVLDQFYNAFFKVALIEEFSKFIFVRFILYPNKNFNEPFDGIVYAVMVSMGFATVENLIYVFEQGFVTGVLRVFTAVPAHATFAVIMGYFLGKAKFSRTQSSYFSTLALIAPTLFHGTYDYFWFISYVPGLWIGGLASLAVGFILSRRAMNVHHRNSPFLPKQKPPEEDDVRTNDSD